ncbi:hypothetical protein FB107DRAFT_277316 [Schizophyllum commune]
MVIATRTQPRTHPDPGVQSRAAREPLHPRIKARRWTCETHPFLPSTSLELTSIFDSPNTSFNMCCTAQTQTSSTPVNVKVATTSDATHNHASVPQCCHCGWRGAHAADCPFK